MTNHVLKAYANRNVHQMLGFSIEQIKSHIFIFLIMKYDIYVSNTGGQSSF